MTGKHTKIKIRRNSERRDEKFKIRELWRGKNRVKPLIFIIVRVKKSVPAERCF